jgi:4-amino-4-deoxy-L-arabinose transferase-like glycosyltransferase
VRHLLRQHARFFALAALAAIALRLFFVFRFPAVTDDSRLYAEIARNWLQHGIYGLTNDSSADPTLARLPGYPAFLAVIFAIFGQDNFRAVLFAQVLVDLNTCLLIADLARRLASARAARIAFLLAAVCPFLANHSGAVLTETLEVFFTAAALDCAAAGLGRSSVGVLQAVEEASRPHRLWPWVGCGAATGAAILLRPDGGLLLASILVYLVILILRPLRQKETAQPIIAAALLVTIIALLPLVPWTARNWRSFHRFQPLAPRYANEEDEFVPMGFNRWVKTWMAEFVSVQEIYWNVPGEKVDPTRLPNRAFDTPEQRQSTSDLLTAYNEQLHVTPEMDAHFAELARARIRAHPVRYYLRLPVLRIADMWLRPRTELTPADPRWWEFNDEPWWSVTTVAFGIINLVYVAFALFGLVQWRSIAFCGLLITFLLLRSLFLGSLENPEPRYTLECYPAIIVLAAGVWAEAVKRFRPTWHNA